MNNRIKKQNGIGVKILVGTFLLFGLVPSLAHYFAPRPDASAAASQFLPVGPAWFLEQLPRYDLHPITTFLHLAPAFLFMLLLGFQLSRSFREKQPHLHRIMGRVLSALAIIFALSGIVIGIQFPFGGAIEMLTSSLVAIIFFYCLYKGIRFARQKNVTQHRLWMLRMVAVSFTPLTMRLLMIPIGYFELADMQTVFGSLMIISAVINLAVLEIIILKRISLFRSHADQVPSTKVTGI